MQPMNPLSTDISAGKRRAARAWVGFTIFYMVATLAAGIFLGLKNGDGLGFGDGRLVQSCYTPGGPYYVKNIPLEWQTCPNPDTPQLKQPNLSVPGNREKLEKLHSR